MDGNVESVQPDLSNEDESDNNSTVAKKTEGVSMQFEKLLKYLTEAELHLTRLQAAMILLSFSYGSAVIILPNTVLELGPLTWILSISMVISITGYCAYLNNQSMCYLLGETKSVDALRDPYLAIAQLAGGPLFRKIVAVVMYIAMISSALAFVLLSASLMSDVFPFHNLYRYNSIRIWVVITCLAVAPLMYFGSFVDLKGAAIFSVTASTVSLIAIFINCIILRFYYDVRSSRILHPNKTIHDTDVFVTFGLITFAVAGPSITLPNIVVHVSKRNKFSSTIAGTFGVIFIIYVFCGTIPYAIFGLQTSEMVTTTFNRMHQKYKGSYVLQIFAIICNVSMSLHLLLESILIINPLYQHAENLLDIPRRINWKRIAVRTCALAIILVSCIAFPTFRSVLSIVGGVPMTLLGIIFPLYIHTRIFDNNVFTKVLHAVVTVFFLVFIIGNFGVTTVSLISSAFNTAKQ